MSMIATVDFAPLEAIAMTMDGAYCEIHRGPRIKTMCDYYGLSERQWHRWKLAQRVTIRQADVVAVKLGFHPQEIWGEQWLEPTSREGAA